MSVFGSKFEFAARDSQAAHYWEVHAPAYSISWIRVLALSIPFWKGICTSRPLPTLGRCFAESRQGLLSTNWAVQQGPLCLTVCLKQKKRSYRNLRTVDMRLKRNCPTKVDWARCSNKADILKINLWLCNGA